MALADQAEEFGMKHLALTDHGNLYGILDFINACKESIDENGCRIPRKNPINPIIGCEIYVTPNSLYDKNKIEDENKNYHLVLLVENRTGYFNLVKLCSLGYTFTEDLYSEPRIRVDYQLLNKYHEGLIALSGCIYGEIPQLVLQDKIEEAKQKAYYYRDIFGVNNFYLEIQNHGISAEGLQRTLFQNDINKIIYGISQNTGIPLVATNNVHYIQQKDASAHDVLLCIGQGKQLSDIDRKRFSSDQFYFKTSNEMVSLFSEYPEAVTNTVKIAERCVADIPAIALDRLHEYLPDFNIPQNFTDANDYLRHIATIGLEKRYPEEKKTGGKKWNVIFERMKYELEIIFKSGFTNYFLIVADYVNWARENGIPLSLGRGSSGGSIVAYCLRITGIDPIKYNLLFERFLNPELNNPPDFDIDFGSESRDEVIKYITKKYGDECVGQIISFGCLTARSVIQETARVMNIPISETEMIAKLIPYGQNINLDKAISSEPRLRELEQDPVFSEIFSIAKKLESLKRYSSYHASGLVIGKYALSNFLPIYSNKNNGSMTSQYTMHHLESCGLLRYDILGLKILDEIKQTEKLVRNRGGEYANFSIENVPLNDKNTYKLFCEGNTNGVFQFESESMQKILKQLQPDCLEHLFAINALFRPGTMVNIPEYIERRHGRKLIDYPHPSLEDILKETYGLIVYQEQIICIIQRITGYSLGKSDILRRYMVKNKGTKSDKSEEKEHFILYANTKGYNELDANSIYELLIPYSGNSFNKSHAVGYSLLAYQTAYLNANF